MRSKSAHAPRWIAAALFSLATAHVATAVNRNWGGGVGTWQTASHWSPAGTPTANDSMAQFLNGNQEIHFSGNGVGGRLSVAASGSSSTWLKMQPGETLTLLGPLNISNNASGATQINRVFLNDGGTLSMASSTASLGIGVVGYGELWATGGSDISSSAEIQVGCATADGDRGYGAFIVSGAGSSVSSPYLTVGAPGSRGSSLARYDDSAIAAHDAVYIGDGSTGALDSLAVRTGAVATVGYTSIGYGKAGVLGVASNGVYNGGSITVYGTSATSRLELEGGTIRTGSLSLSNASQLYWTTGTLDITNSSPYIGNSGTFGTSLAVPSGGTLRVSGANRHFEVGSTGSLSGSSLGVGATVSASDQIGVSSGSSGTFYTSGTTFISGATRVTSGGFLGLYGGTFRTGSLDLGGDSSRFYWDNSATFELTGSSLTIGSTGLLGSTLTTTATKQLRITGANQNLTVAPGATLFTPSLAVGGTLLSTDSVGVSTGSGGTLNVQGVATINGILRVGTDGAVNITGDLRTQALNSSAGTVSLDGGTLRPLSNSSSWIQGSAAISIRSNGGTINTSGLNVAVDVPIQHDPSLGAATDGGITKSGTGTLTLSKANTYTGGTRLTGGSLVISHPDAFGTGGLTLSSNTLVKAQTVLAKAISVNDIFALGTSSLDLGPNAMVVKGSTLASITQLITVGFHGGDWLGRGITSSTASDNPTGLTGIGYMSNADPSLGSFEGVSGLDADDVLVKYTYYGDADLNGTVDPDDFNAFLAGYQNSSLPRTWAYGDFDYNNVIDPDDFNLFLAAFQANGAPLSEIVNAIEMSSLSSSNQQLLLGAVSAVPEPTTLGLLGLAAAGLVARRRRA